MKKQLHLCEIYGSVDRFFGPKSGQIQFAVGKFFVCLFFMSDHQNDISPVVEVFCMLETQTELTYVVA